MDYEFAMVTTKGGDSGMTSLYGYEQRFRKDGEIFDVLGDLDELNSHVGLAKAHYRERFNREIDRGEAMEFAVSELLEDIQSQIIHISSELATRKDSPEASMIPRLEPAALERMEACYREVLDTTAIPAVFVHPGASIISAQFDVARTVCRRCERRLVHAHAPVAVITYINRLSDLLFTIARAV